MWYKTISYTINENGIATIFLPRLVHCTAGASSPTQDLTALLARIAADPEIRTVILAGEPQAAPASNAQLEGASEDLTRQVKEVNRLTVALVELPKPVIAAVSGLPAHLGLPIALAADIAIASSETEFSVPAFFPLETFPDIGTTYLFPRLIGKAKAKEILFTHQRIAAQEALQLGLVSQVVQPEEVLETAYALAEKIVQGPPFLFRLAKRMINHCDEIDLHAALHMEDLSQRLFQASTAQGEHLPMTSEKQPVDPTG